MKNIKRVVNTNFWSDEKVLNDFSPEDKYFMLFLLTNEYSTQLGVYHLPIKKAALDLGYSVEAVKVLIERFEYKYHIIKWSEATSEIAIKNYLLHSIVKGGKPVYDCLIKEENTVIDKSLLGYIYHNLKDKNISNSTVSEYINHLSSYKDKYIYINDNDNERFVDESWTNRTPTDKSSNSADLLFNELWSLYPKKEGKGKVSASQKGKIGKIGKEEMIRAIERYKAAKKNTDPKYIMHGSTFFNSGYVDYLDANYAETSKSQMSGMEAFLNAKD